MAAMVSASFSSSPAMRARPSVATATRCAPGSILTAVTAGCVRKNSTNSSIQAASGLAVVCTALAFLVFFALIAEVGPVRATVITYVNPAVAVLLGVLTLGEPVTAGLLVGFPLVLLGTDYWQGMIDWLRDRALVHGTISQSDIDMLRLTDDVDEAVELMVASREGQTSS